jgi:hypothetical protein
MAALQGLKRMVKLQVTLNKNFLIMMGIGGFYMYSDHLILRRLVRTASNIGIMHDSNTC